MYPSIFHISSRFFATGFRSFRNFFKVWSPIENHLEEIRKIEGYTRDVESSKVTYFRCKESKIIKISHFQNITWRFWAQEERKSVCNFLLSLEMDQNAQNMIILFKKDFVPFQSDMLSSLSEDSWVGTQKKRSFHPVTSWQTPWWQPTCPSGSWKPRSKGLVLTMPAAKQGHNSVLAWKMQAFALVVAISILSLFLRFFLLTEGG